MAHNAPTILATPQTKVLTTGNGNPVDDNQNSMTAGQFCSRTSTSLTSSVTLPANVSLSVLSMPRVQGLMDTL
ncbi:hypothetical protein BGZ58_002137, partial [Dissophora ornata]